MREIVQKRYELECGHEVWYRTPPVVGDYVYCLGCEGPSQVGPVSIKGRVTWFSTWKLTWRRVRGTAECMTCGYTESSKDFYHLRDSMERHHLYTHCKSSLVWATEPLPVTKPLSPNAPAPF